MKLLTLITIEGTKICLNKCKNFHTGYRKGLLTRALYFTECPHHYVNELLLILHEHCNFKYQRGVLRRFLEKNTEHLSYLYVHLATIRAWMSTIRKHLSLNLTDNLASINPLFPHLNCFWWKKLTFPIPSTRKTLLK